MKYADEGIQYHLNIKRGDLGRYVLLPGDPKRCARIAAFFEHSSLVADSREYVTYTGYLDGEKVSVTSTGIGGPSAAIAMEELVKCGADTFIRVGTCGGMDRSVRGGDIVIATGAVRMEGTSKEYAPIEYPAVADLAVSNALVKAAEQMRYHYHTGVVECKDSFYGQHEPHKMPVSYELQNKWEAWLRLGCKASEMESAALFIVAGYLRVRCGSDFLVVANQEREKAGLDNPVIHDTESAIKVAVEALKILIRDDKEKNGVRSEGMERNEILRRVDHTLLKQTATWNEIREICDDGVAWGTASVCIPPSYVKQAADYLKGKLPVCTVIGFPNGYQTTAVKVFETKEAVRDGALEIDMVINLGWVKDGRYDLVKSEIQEIKEACGGKLLKVIIETCLLSDEEKAELCRVVSDTDAEYIKTSTGFSKGGATREDVLLMKAHMGEGKLVKAAGGMESFEDGEEFILAGADRLGTSRLVKLAKADGVGNRI